MGTATALARNSTDEIRADAERLSHIILEMQRCFVLHLCKELAPGNVSFPQFFLLAYLDGQLETGQSSEVSQLAGANSEISRRVMRLKRTQAQLLETFGAFAREDVALPRSAFQFDDGDAFRMPQRSMGLHQAGLFMRRQVNLRFIAGDHGF